MNIAILAILTFILHSRTRKQPLHPDSGFYLYIPFFKNTGYKFSPSKVISLSPNKLTGDYNILDTKFLLRLFIHVTMYFDRSIKSFRLFYAFYNLLTGLAIFVLASLIGSPFFATVAASIYWIMSLSPYHDSFQLHAEQYAFLPMILAVIIIVMACRGDALQVFMFERLMLLLVSGILLGIVIICLKISYVVEIATILLISALWGIGIWNMACLVSGISVVMLFILIYSYMKTGSLDLFLYAYSPRSHLYYKKAMLSDFNIDGGIVKYGFKTYFTVLSCFFLGAYYFVIGIVYSIINHNTTIVAISLLTFASLVNIGYQRKFYMAHFYSLLPFSSIVAAYGIEQMFGLTGVSFVLNICFSIILLIPALAQISQYYIKFDTLAFHIKRSQVIRHKKTLNFVAEEGIAEYVRHKTEKEDFILQWGYNHEFYVLAQRRAALSGHLAATLMTDPLLNDASISNWKKNVLMDIENFIPKFIVDFDGSLRIETINETSGHYYKLDRNFYGIYPLYRAVDTHCSVKKTTTTDILKSLTENDTKRNINNMIFRSNYDFIQFVNRLVMKDNIKEADIYAEGGITKMFNDWQRINNEKLSVQGLLNNKL